MFHLRCHGDFNGQQVLAPAVFDEICMQATVTRLQQVPGCPWAVRTSANGGFNHDHLGSYACRGQYGQRIWIAPQAEVMIALLHFILMTTLPLARPLST
jgi:CubicO group peptidase (beta-lactamase class C family)